MAGIIATYVLREADHGAPTVLSAIAVLGAQVLRGLEYFGELSELHLRTLVHLTRGNVEYRPTIEQMSSVGVSSLPIVAVTMLFSGMVFSYHVADQAMLLGASSYVGWAVAETMARELGPALTAIVVAARAGSAMAAELGTMKVTEQIDALRTMATDPVQYLVVPRYLAAMVMVPILALVGDIIGVTGGFTMANATAGLSANSYFGSIPGNLELWTVVAGVIKAIFFGIIIAVIGCHQGLYTQKASEEVGRATTRAVVYCIMLIYAANLALTVLLFP
ncbi:MAG TPA: ABC transporter permease [Armatimonadetes bacterium]|nr:ABC transporter permease [Armatimonadota bacterium]